MYFFNNYLFLRILIIYIGISSFISIFSVFAILIFQFLYSYKAIQWNFTTYTFLSTNWNPYHQEYGMIPMLFGSLSVSLISLIFILITGIHISIFINFYLKRFQYIIKSFLELLAGIPSIIYGLFGITVLSSWIQNIFQLSTGRTIFSASLILTFMVIPTFITLLDDAWKQINFLYKETLLSLGLTRWEIIKTSIFFIKREIIYITLLSYGRVLGETMAVMLVIGSIDKLPSPLWNLFTPGQTITSKLGREISEASFGSLHFSELIFASLILSFLIFLISIILLRIGKQK